MGNAVALSSETYLDHDQAAFMLDRMRDDHRELGSVTPQSDGWAFPLHYGMVSAVRENRRIRLRVLADDETRLAYVKMEVANHAAEILGSTGGIRWSGQDDIGTVPAFFREITVLSTERITPHLQRIRFAARDLGRYASGGLHIRLLLPPAGREPVWPIIGADGLLVWPDGEDALIVRVYTIRAIDVQAGVIDVDFVLHPGVVTPAAHFAETATPGQVIGMIGPGGGDVPAATNLLMLADDTALPALSRILESLPETTRATVFLEVDGETDRLALERPNVTITWLYRSGQPAGTAGLLSAALREMDPQSVPEDVYVWAGCEFADFRQIRRIVRKDWGLGKDRQLIVSYWRRGVGGEDRPAAED